ncbi:MAG: hypothetical protein ACERK0_16795 [Deltaproteobacteria bacterium]
MKNPPIYEDLLQKLVRVYGGANEFLTYGIEEAPIQWWHEELTRRLDAES